VRRQIVKHHLVGIDEMLEALEQYGRGKKLCEDSWRALFASVQYIGM